MLGGDPESKVSRAHAKELLATAPVYESGLVISPSLGDGGQEA